MYADTVTQSMEAAIRETNRRRDIQQSYNAEHGIVPHTVVKGIRDLIDLGAKDTGGNSSKKAKKKLTAKEKDKLIETLTKEMKQASRELEFEKAAFLRDKIRELREGKQ